MSRILFGILTLAIGYLLGSISTGILLSKKFAHVDVRTMGSGNAGTTNMLRVLGKKYAVLTLVGDMLKGIIAVYIGFALVGGQTGKLLGAFGAILGHNYPLYFGFKGGKGIATSFGCLLFVFPLQTAAAFGVFLLLTAVTRYVSVGSIAAAVTLPIFVICTTPPNAITWVFSTAIGALAIWRHRVNIIRLIEHKENKLSFSKKKQA